MEDEEEKFDWVVVFRVGERRIYTYMNRSKKFMANALKVSHDRHGYWPYRVWAIVNGEMVKAKINVPEPKKEEKA